MELSKKSLILWFILIAKVPTVIPVQNDGPYLSNKKNNNLHQTFQLLPENANQINMQSLPSLSNNNGNSIDQQTVLLQSSQVQYPMYPFPQPKRKHYKITLIRPPPQPIQPPAPQPEIEEQTIVYVLVKKAEEPKIEIEEAQPIFKSSKPEVYFIKYQTKDEKDSPTQQQISTTSNAPAE